MTRSTGLSGFFKKSLSIFLLLYVLFTAVTFSSAAEKPVPKRILAIFTFKQGLPWAYQIEQGLRAGITADATFPIELNVEHADRPRFSDEIYIRKLVDLYKHKYSRQKMDIVLAVGDEASNLLLEYGEDVFGQIPFVLISTKNKNLPQKFLKSNIISLFSKFDFIKTVNIIQDVLPQTRNLFIISGSSLTDRRLNKLAHESLHGAGLNIKFLADLTIEDLLKTVARLPDNSAILYLSLFRDANSKTFVPREIMSVISQKANAPTFGIVDTYLGYGIVGGLY